MTLVIPPPQMILDLPLDRELLNNEYHYFELINENWAKPRRMRIKVEKAKKIAQFVGFTIKYDKDQIGLSIRQRQRIIRKKGKEELAKRQIKLL